MAGKTGADAVATAISHICRTVHAYHTKLLALIEDAEIAAVLTHAQADIARNFVASVEAACVVFELIAAFNSVTP